MLWDYDKDKDIKHFLLDFLIASQDHFRGKEPFEISLREGIDYINAFIARMKETGE